MHSFDAKPPSCEKIRVKSHKYLIDDNSEFDFPAQSFLRIKMRFISKQVDK